MKKKYMESFCGEKKGRLELHLFGLQLFLLWQC